MAYADVFRPVARRPATLYDVALIGCGSAFIALASRVAIPLPFSPVPVTGQTLAVLLIGTLLGSRRGALCLLLYLGEGAVGLPVFAGGKAGLPHLLGPTGGYLIGFVASAFVTGRLAERGWDRRVTTTLAAMLLGNGVIYAFGSLWLAGFVGAERALALGLLPFIPGDLFKVVLAAALLPLGWTLVRRTR
jgi:biotin transport system substrate-specific component